MWVRADGDIATVGISQYGQEQLGSVVYVDLPPVGQAVKAGQELGFTTESQKTIAELLSPVTGSVTEVNQALAVDPAAINIDPYATGWLVKIELNGELPRELLDAAGYRKLVGA